MAEFYCTNPSMPAGIISGKKLNLQNINTFTEKGVKTYKQYLIQLNQMIDWGL